MVAELHAERSFVKVVTAREISVIASDEFPSLQAKNSRHCERSVAVHEPEFAAMF